MDISTFQTFFIYRINLCLFSSQSFYPFRNLHLFQRRYLYFYSYHYFEYINNWMELTTKITSCVQSCCPCKFNHCFVKPFPPPFPLINQLPPKKWQTYVTWDFLRRLPLAKNSANLDAAGSEFRVAMATM